jgi:crotonobetainyl-CoA:carnitine CoA-transferase CaiB-like acyl-CoA transferase
MSHDAHAAPVSTAEALAASDLPLAGITVVDLTRILAGPFCTQLLGDLGADVIKIESPDGGDPLRDQGAKVDGLSWYFATYNRNKRSIVLDLRSAEGRTRLESLLANADVLVENFRPDVLDKMGLTTERLRTLNPRLVVCGISGFGRTGPYALRPSFDFIAQAMSGYMSVNGREGEAPLRTAIPVSDLIGGLYAALGVVAELMSRDRLGRARHVGVSLLSSLMSFLSFHGADYLATGALPVRTGNDHPIRAPYGLFETADAPIAVAPSTAVTYERFMKGLGLDHVLADPRFADNDLRMARRAELTAIIETVTRTRPQAHWITHLNAAGVPCGPVLSVGEAFADAQVRHEGLVVDVPHGANGTVKVMASPIRLDDRPLPVRRPAPALGEHQDEVESDAARA